MCGIVGYIGEKEAVPILLKGLRRLEYRGYDSAGIAVIESEKIIRVRAVGRIDNLAEALKDNQLYGHVGIAHTRWATHGGATKENAHPHVALNGKLALVHNGIIENYREIRDQLGNIILESQTDSEILVHLIASFYIGDLRQAVLKALHHVRGTYGLVVIHAEHPHELIVARLGSPLVVGIGEGEQYVASDATPIIPYTRKVIFLEDGEVGRLTKNGLETTNLSDELVTKCVEEIEWTDEQAEKQVFPHFMLKEIFDQPQVFQDAIRGRYNFAEGTAYLGGLNMTEREIHSIERIILIACGTARYAAMIGKYAFERLTGIPTEVDIASEFRYRDPIITNKTLVFAISQSGETADTLAAVREAKRRGAFVRGIVNVVGSTIARETDGGTYMHAGLEFSVASTKAYTNMIAILLLYAIQFGRTRRITLATGQRLLYALCEIPQKMEEILSQANQFKVIAEHYAQFQGAFFLGRGINFPVALEGSHKLKEITYIHSEAYPAGEMKHGANALLAPDFPIIGLLTKDQLYDKMRSNIEEVKARKSPIMLVATKGDTRVREITDDVMYVPDTMELLEPLLNTIPLQLFAYYIAVSLGRDIDRPRNLAKSVTVE